MRKLLALTFALTFALALTSSGACQRAAPSRGAVPAVATVVTVRNNRFHDMDVFVVRGGGGASTRLGVVTGNSSTRFVIPAFVVGRGATLRFYADPIGPSGVRVSEELNVLPGDNVQLDISP